MFRFEKETSREEAELFVDLLVRNNRGGVKEGDAREDSEPATVHILVTMRSEFLGDCARFKGLAEAINRTQYLVPGMDRASLMRAIRRPAPIYGGEVTLELAEKLITEAAGREDELPPRPDVSVELVGGAGQAGRRSCSIQRRSKPPAGWDVSCPSTPMR